MRASAVSFQPRPARSHQYCPLAAGGASHPRVNAPLPPCAACRVRPQRSRRPRRASAALCSHHAPR
eukprot:scaffold68442_cov36-Tisochrysis_lutea.AAC.1